MQFLQCHKHNTVLLNYSFESFNVLKNNVLSTMILHSSVSESIGAVNGRGLDLNLGEIICFQLKNISCNVIFWRM